MKAAPARAQPHFLPRRVGLDDHFDRITPLFVVRGSKGFPDVVQRERMGDVLFGLQFKP